MSSERYEILQDDFEALLERIDASMEWVTKKTSGHNEQKSGLSRCQSQLDEARSLLSEMEQEARSAPLNYRSEMMTNLRKYRESIAKIQATIRKKEIELTKERIYKEVPDASGGENRSHDELLREQIIRGSAVLERTSQSLHRSTAVAHETEEVGNTIVNDLSVQRETLERARGMLHETDVELSRSRRILKRISRGTLYNKVVLIFIIIIQVIIIGALIYWKWFS